MTTKNPSHDDEARSLEQERAARALTDALETGEVAEKDYKIREALQLLTLGDE